MKRRQIWGTALIIVVAPFASAYHVINEAYRAAAREDLLLYVGMPVDSIAPWFLVVALLSGAVGLLLLLPALIGRTPRKVPRRIIGWTAVAAAAAAVPYFCLMFFFLVLGAFGIGDTVKITAADGQSVLITQDGFDGDSVDIYAEHDEYRYTRIRRAYELGGWPRVKDQSCQLATVDGLRLTCGARTVTVDQKGT
jgi:hypothetical protein